MSQCTKVRKLATAEASFRSFSSGQKVEEVKKIRKVNTSKAVYTESCNVMARAKFKFQCIFLKTNFVIGETFLLRYPYFN